MEIINKKSKIIQRHRKYARFAPFLRVGETKYVHFPVSTVEMAKMRLGEYVHFTDMGRTICFFTNNDSSGFKLIANSTRDEALRICSAGLVDWFHTKLKIAKGKSISYYVIDGMAEHKGAKLYEVLTDNPRPEDLKKTVKK